MIMSHVVLIARVTYFKVAESVIASVCDKEDGGGEGREAKTRKGVIYVG